MVWIVALLAELKGAMIRLHTREVLHIGILKWNPPIHTAECSVQPSTTKLLLTASPTPWLFARRVSKIHQLIIKNSSNKLGTSSHGIAGIIQHFFRRAHRVQIPNQTTIQGSLIRSSFTDRSLHNKLRRVWFGLAYTTVITQGLIFTCFTLT